MIRWRAPGSRLVLASSSLHVRLVLSQPCIQTEVRSSVVELTPLRSRACTVSDPGLPLSLRVALRCRSLDRVILPRESRKAYGSPTPMATQSFVIGTCRPYLKGAAHECLQTTWGVTAVVALSAVRILLVLLAWLEGLICT